MKLRLILSILILVTTLSCSTHLSKSEVLFNETIRNYVEIIAQKEQMYAYGTGGSMMGGPNMDLIRKFNFAFRSKKLVDMKQARAITIRCVEQLLSMVNENEEIRPFLEFYPFPPKGADLTLVFLPFDTLDPFSEKVYISTIFFMKEKIYYLQYDHDKKNDDFIYEETYQEALERNANNAERDM